MMDINDRIPTTEVVSAIKILNKCYTLYKPWPGHDSHFHISFVEWLECPQTCVEEVQASSRENKNKMSITWGSMPVKKLRKQTKNVLASITNDQIRQILKNYRDTGTRNVQWS